MRFLPTAIAGAYLVEPERHEDERGYFARVWSARELAQHGLEPRLAHCSVSFNRVSGTLRGLHYQVPPFAEAKLIRCTRGALYDVAVDLRPESPSFRKWIGLELAPDHGRAIYIPHGCAHGFLTLADATEITYHISAEYSPPHARGMRWNDPFVGVAWPRPVTVIAPRDRDYPDVTAEQLEQLRGVRPG